MKKRYLFGMLLSFAMLLSACGSATSSGGGSAQSSANASTAAAKTAANTAQQAGSNAQNVQRKLVANANLRLTLKEYETSEQKIRDLATSINGYVVSSSATEIDGEKNGSLVLRVPAEKLQSFLDQLTKLDGITVETSNVTSEDVTSNYIDLDARLKALHAESDRLNALLQRASTVDEILKINTEVSKVQEQTEQAQGQMNYLQHNVDFSQVSLTLSSSGRVIPGKQQSAFTRAGSTFKSNLGGVGNFFVGLFVFVIGYFPTLLLLFLIGYGIFYLIRRGRRKKRQMEGLLHQQHLQRQEELKEAQQEEVIAEPLEEQQAPSEVPEQSADEPDSEQK